MAEGTAILAHEGIRQIGTADTLRIDLEFEGGVWVNDVVSTNRDSLSRSGNSLVISENVDYENTTGGSQILMQARVVLNVPAVITEVLFPTDFVGGTGGVTLESDQILRFTNISCDING